MYDKPYEDDEETARNDRKRFNLCHNQSITLRFIQKVGKQIFNLSIKLVFKNILLDLFYYRLRLINTKHVLQFVLY